MNKSSFSNRLRVRACAVIQSGGNLLLLKHRSPTRSEPIWMPPGGEVLFGETIESALVREVSEETGLLVDPVRLVTVHEFIEPPFHAVEFYYECNLEGGMLKIGDDPELPADEQIILDLKFVSAEEAETIPLYPEFLYNFFKGETLSMNEGKTSITGNLQGK